VVQFDQKRQYAAFQMLQSAKRTSLADVRYWDLDRTSLELECLETLRRMVAPPVGNGQRIRTKQVAFFVSEMSLQVYQLVLQSDLVGYVPSSIVRLLKGFSISHRPRCTLLPQVPS
jgi:hypothetical protein